MKKDERRIYKRIQKHFILKYYPQGQKKTDKHAITQIKNISIGGICFVSDDPIDPGTVLLLELNTPYLTDTAYLEGEVLQSHEKITGMLYETRLRFENLSEEAKFVLNKLMEYFELEEKKHEK